MCQTRRGTWRLTVVAAAWAATAIPAGALGQGDLLTCASSDGARAFCSADTSRGVTLVRELGRQPCAGNWGWDDAGVWVEGGCEAEFRLGGEAAPSPSPAQGLLGALTEALVGPAPGDAAPPASDEVVCESKDRRRSHCKADTSGGVVLAAQLSRSPCEGNWGYDDTGVWVDNGCRARFKLQPRTEGEAPAGPPAPPGPITLVCDSEGGQRKHCPADTSGEVRLVRQLSRSSCVGHWGSDAQGIWVDGGCRAEFEIEPELDARPATPTAPVTIRCEAQDGRRQVCPADIVGEVRLVRQLSRSSCVGHWGFDKNGIWVDEGCRAEFEVELAAPPVPPSPGAFEPWETMVCQSRDGRRAFCSADTSAGVRLLRQVGSTSCSGNWGFDGLGIWVDRGCQAEFGLGGTAPSGGSPSVVTPASVVRCESMDGQLVRCPASTSAGVRLLRRLSREPCVGHWGYESDLIWVDGGCRAEFDTGGGE